MHQTGLIKKISTQLSPHLHLAKRDSSLAMLGGSLFCNRFSLNPWQNGTDSPRSQVMQHSDIDPRKRHDFQTRQDQVECQMHQWRSQLPDLMDAYLIFKANRAKISEPETPGTWNLQVINFEHK